MLIGDAAKFLGVCVATLRNWHRSGKLVPEVSPLTGTRIYRQKDLEKFLEDHNTEVYKDKVLIHLKKLLGGRADLEKILDGCPAFEKLLEDYRKD